MTVTVLAGATVVTMDAARRVLDDGAVAFDEDGIRAVGPTAEVRAAYPDADVVDCGGQLVLPGFVNTHTHLFQTLLKGLGDDRVLSDWFLSMTGPSAVELTPEDVYAGALHGCAEALTTGTTTLLDFMYVHPRPGLGDAVVEAMADVGIRGVLARGYMTAGEDVGVPPQLVQPVDAALSDAARLISTWNRPRSRVTVGLAPCMSWSVDAATLTETRALADATGALVTMHLSESPFDVDESVRRFGVRDVPFAAQTGLLGPDLLAAHCVQVDATDLDLLAASDTKVSHNPCSNLYLGSGFAPVPEMQRRGITVGLASDGPASSSNHSMLQAMKFAALLHKGVHRDPEIMTAEKALEMATIDGARALGMADVIGSLEVGKRADVVVLDLSNLCVTPVHAAVSSLVYSQRGDEVRQVYVDGQLVVADGSLVTVPEEDIRARSIAAARGLAARAGTDRFATRPWRSTVDA
ncbi:putative amidohydrolase [Modestobacter italicus]|uniref:Amidohydrolase n=1 Tax=Modestobacter italicus (strain DSM 44449 / CECT 9708 / BC 501) TaxID=2732864 RepID=I4F1I8_MODI5|nr:amidohydrolase [Modestobacter marinus]CCH89501.1 putative amidohydrolase [Modestobacter marinus]